MTSYQRHIATMSLPHTISEINGDFSRKSSIFPTPEYLTPLLKGFPLYFGTDVRDQKTIMMGLPDNQKQFYDRFSHSDTIPVCDRQADRHSCDDSKDRA